MKQARKQTTTRKKSQQHWTWIIIITFFVLGILDTRFGILGIVCMGVPIIHALKGDGKIHCSKYCPRGSFLGKFLDKISMHKQLPGYMRTKKAKHVLLIIMLTMLSIAMYHTGFVFEKMAFAFLRFMGMSFAVGIIMGVFFKPRSWCVVCPMGHASGLIAGRRKKIVKRRPVYEGE
ncbi:4Fe-4S binding protein [Vallitaleaceae bacterium 9-2]